MIFDPQLKDAPTVDDQSVKSMAEVLEFPYSAARSGNQSPNHEAAVRLAQAGLPVFPALVTQNGITGRWDKVPLVSGWQDKATTDREQIEHWWTNDPDAVPGIELG